GSLGKQPQSQILSPHASRPQPVEKGGASVGRDHGHHLPIPEARRAGLMRSVLVRLAGWFSRSRREREWTAEFESHLQLHIDDNLRSGMSEEEARRQALVKFG